ncbi:hypothetical protein ACQJBY_020695 [Aegilops geniculata]
MRGSEVLADARKWDVSNSWSICLLERTGVCKLLKEYLLLIRRPRRKKMVRRQEEEEDGAALDPEADEEEDEASIIGAEKETEAESLPRVLKVRAWNLRSGEASEARFARRAILRGARRAIWRMWVMGQSPKHT